MKIPGTLEGIPAIEEAIFIGVPINVTLLFSREQYVAAAEAYLRGIERRIAAGLDLRVPSVASLFVSRWDKAVSDKAPAELRNRLGIAIGQRASTAPIASCWPRRAGATCRRRSASAAPAVGQHRYEGSRRLRHALPRGAGGARHHQHHSRKHLARVRPTRSARGRDGGRRRRRRGRAGPLRNAGIDIDALATQLLHEGALTFDKSWQELMQRTAEKRGALANAVQRG